MPGDTPERRRLRVTIHGAVQGVGFRPHVYRLATGLGLTGWVNNSPSGVFIEVEGPPSRLETFLLRLEKEKPPRASIQSLESSLLDPAGYEAFLVRESDEAGPRTAVILPDIATCPDCLREVLDPANRRFHYPFTNCTNCGPRFSIIERLPYDRPNTTMRQFPMCEACRAEYENPADRRFHAQPIACPACGPRLELWDAAGKIVARDHDALLRASEAVRAGKTVAVKGIGGFHLVVDALQADAVRRLRQRKNREEKPLALMYPSIESVRADCEVSALEERLLLSPESPIVLLRRLPQPKLMRPAHECPVAPRNPYLGIMLPYTPLHHLLMRELNAPLVATSGNLSEEPICTDEHEALERLAGMADLFLVHNRPIARHVDDSIVRVSSGRELVLRRARGYAPLPIRVRGELPPLVAVGPHLKNTVAVAAGDQVCISQHIGDLETPRALEAFQRVMTDLEDLYEVAPARIGCDLHPDYLSTRHARSLGLPVIPVQHHHAHIVSCMAENELEGEVLGVAWDGTGYGTDGTVWGGEFLIATADAFSRIAHFRTFRLPGGEQAIREPRRAALGLLYEMSGDEALERDDLAPVRAFSAQERRVLQGMLQKGVNCPVTSSAGRLFDVVASLLDLRQVSRFEGQAAMEAEFALAETKTDDHYPVAFSGGKPWILDWAPAIELVIGDLQAGRAAGLISARFHNMLAESMVEIARLAGCERVVLSGGCFQNRYLTERTVQRLCDEGFQPYWHQRVPPNDGGVALGQAVVAGRRRGMGNG